MKICISLPVTMRRHVHGNSVYKCCYVGPMIAIEATHKNLLRLTPSRMLRNEQTRNQAQSALAKLGANHQLTQIAKERLVQIDALKAPAANP